MSIDYDRLRELADKASPGPWRADEHDYMDGQTVYNANGVPLAFYLSENSAELVALAPDMARELLRLRDGVGELVERKRAAVKRLDITRPIAAAILDVTCDDLEDLFKGDTK